MVQRCWGLEKMHGSVRTTVLVMTDELRVKRMSGIVYRSRKLLVQPGQEENELLRGREAETEKTNGAEKAPSSPAALVVRSMAVLYGGSIVFDRICSTMYRSG